MSIQRGRPEIVYVDPGVVAAKTQQWTPGQLACRFAKFHSWPPLKHGMTLISHGEGYFEVQQVCTRRCGVTRKGMFSETGYLIKPWRPDYSSEKAKDYLLRTSDGRSVGRIGPDGNAEIFLASLRDATVSEVTE